MSLIMLLFIMDMFANTAKEFVICNFYLVIKTFVGVTSPFPRRGNRTGSTRASCPASR